MTTLADIAVRTRVQLTQDVDNYPTIYAQTGLKGVVASLDHGRVMITLDEYRQELDDWNNQLEVSLEHFDEDDLPFDPL